MAETLIKFSSVMQQWINLPPIFSKSTRNVGDGVSVPLRGKMFQILSREGGVGFWVLGVFAARMGKCRPARPMSVTNARKGLY